MPPSQTVENYLKAIFQAQIQSADFEALVPMGHLSSALGVVPGTATAMVKTLSDAGLVHYEPYSGVRLTEAGAGLAGRVLRRHRLVELFLVKVVGMSWDEVHEEAERLEHAVSDALIERIDVMLGHPTVDPHGDPIPGPEGTLARPEYDTLLSCPLNRPVHIRRVIDQDPPFLRFIEESDLKPGQVIEVEARDGAADRVHVRTKNDRRVTIGARAAATVLVQAALALCLAAGVGRDAAAQSSAPGRTGAPPAPARPFQILDNSFLVEEAFNQEAGVFQNIVGFVRVAGAWEAMFTQEWPLGGQRHQLSYSVPVVSAGAGVGAGDVVINYRWQAADGTGRAPACSPRRA